MPVELNTKKPLTKKELSSPIKSFIEPVETSLLASENLGKIIDSLRSKHPPHQIYYFYAVDDRNHLLGVVSTRDILFNDPLKKILDVTNEKIIKLQDDTCVEEALKIVSQYKLLTIPVVDCENRLLGVFKVTSSSIDEAPTSQIKQTKISEAFYFIGLSIELGKINSSIKEYRSRMPWLICNLIAGFACAAIGNLFVDLLQTVVVISIFIPLVLTLGESVSMQSMTFSLQFLDQGQLPVKLIWKRLTTEWKTSILLGLTCCLFLGIAYLLLGFPINPLFSIIVSIFISIFIAINLGTLFPIILHLFRLDPRVAAGPVILMFTDIAVTTSYFLIASWLLNH